MVVPSLMDTKGLVAFWRESLLAKMFGKTKQKDIKIIPG